MKNSYLFTTLVFGIAFSGLVMGQSPAQYQNVVNKTAAQVHAGYPKTAFCRFAYNSRFEIDMPGASFLTPKQRKVSWMTIVPLSRVGKDLACYHSRCQWQKRVLSGPVCCTLRNARYKKIEGDLHNRLPVVPMLKQWRGDREFGKVSRQHETGECGVLRDDKVIEPPDSFKGTVGRAYLYLHDLYDIGLTDSERELFTKWHQTYPPESWEKTWDMQIGIKQGKHNPYIYRGKENRRQGEQVSFKK